MAQIVSIEVTINDELATLDVRSEEDLATALRRAGYTGVKCGCDSGVCGASKVLIDGTASMACAIPASEAAGSEVVTIEGLGTQDELHPIQQAFVDHWAVQCGFCIPGMIIEAVDLLETEPDPSERQVRDALADNYCRCTGYQKPVEAIMDAAGQLRGESPVATDGGVNPDREGHHE